MIKTMEITHLQIVDVAPEDLVNRLAARDAALWFLSTTASEREIELSVDLITLPWQLALIESSSGKLATEIGQRSADDFARARGPIFAISRNPVEIELPRRSLPAFFLNGRDDSVDSEERSGTPSSHKSQVRRLNMFDR